MIPIENDDEYKIIMFRDNTMLRNITCYADNNKYTLHTFHSKRYQLRALAGMGKPLVFMLNGIIWGWNDADTYSKLLLINHHIETEFTGCTGEKTPERWIKIVKKIEEKTQNIQEPRTSDCQYTNSIDGIYNCYTAQQRDFIQAKWTALRQKDTTLSKHISRLVRLHYRENKLKKVVFLRTIDDGTIIVGLKKDRYMNEKEKKYLKQILFEMPCYIIPQAGKKRRISYVYRLPI